MMNLKGSIMAKFVDLTGNRYGRLEVIERAENGANCKARWLCKCDCGNEKVVTRNELNAGDSKSCGCLRQETVLKVRPIGGKKKFIFTDEHQLSRCINSFNKKIEKTDTCWLWTASTTKGYGSFKYKNIRTAHRFSFFVHKGEIENGKLICHTCDNPKCVNPDHLYAGTVFDNANDRKQRGHYGRKQYKSLDVR